LQQLFVYRVNRTTAPEIVAQENEKVADHEANHGLIEVPLVSFTIPRARNSRVTVKPSGECDSLGKSPEGIAHEILLYV